MLSIADISIRIAGRLLIDQATVQIVPGARVGLVGRNGTGKSTLFQAIRGDIPTESGQIAIPPRWRVGSLAQEAPDGPESLIEVVLAADLERAALLHEAETAHDPHRIADIQTRLVDIDAHSAPARAAAILSGLGFSTEDQSRPCSEFSGGWRMRVALAATLFAEPDLLLLDEPTNYLDLEGTLWLEDHLARYPRTVIIVSHDRDLLENSVDQILHLDRAKLTLYRGGYSSFEKQRAARELLDAKQVKRQQAERERLQAFVDRFKAKASKARQAQSRVKMLERMQPISALVTQDVREIVFPEPSKLLSPPIIAVNGVSVGYDPEKPVLNRVTLRIDNDDRIALLGQNGNGKSTLVKLLAGRLAPFTGHVTRADKLLVGYFAQHQLDELNEDGSPYSHIRKLLPDAPESKVRARAGSIGFSSAAADTPIRSLSGGEKARLLLGLATFFGPAVDHPRRAHQPSRHRQPRGACRGDQRVSRRRYHGEPRPLPDRRMCRPALGGGEPRGHALRRRSRGLSPRGAFGAGPAHVAARPQRESAGRRGTARQGAKGKHATAPENLRRRSGDRTHQRHHRQDRRSPCAAGYFCARAGQGGPAQQGAQCRS